ncbi:MAG: type II secretion system protein GspC [Gammaproteobacteria bacterium]|nr:type II secretion system protein GspC [Gammaproteobacteria bacterium]
MVIILAIVAGKMITDYIAFTTLTSQSQRELTVDEAIAVNSQINAGNSTQPPTGVLSLFGVSEQSLTDASKASVELQETQLKLILRGIMVNQENNQRLALIAVPGSVEKVYAIDDEIEGARIVGIEPGRVVLNHNGKDEALYLTIPKVAVDQNKSTSKTGNVSEKNGIRKINDTQRVMSQQTLRQQLNNLPALLRQAKAVPYSENGENVGFKVVEISSGSIFEDLGVQKEDIIQSVNGRPLKSAEDALNAYRRLRTSKSFQLSVLRNGRPVSLNLSVQ